MGIRKFDKKIWLSSPYIHREERKYVQEAFDTNWMSTVGPNIDELEKSICEYMGCKAAAALASGTSALHLAVKLAGVGEGDIVICSDMTFVATVNPVIYEKAEPVFIDCERDTWNMGPEALEAALLKYRGSVKAVIVADLYGTPAKLDEIKALCDEYEVTLIEDAAESLSATYKGRQTGTFGKFNIISFNGNKIITGTSGGMLLSDDEELIAHARKLSTQARDEAPWYQHSETGYNYRMSNVIAGIARGQLEYLEEHRAGKKKIYERYKAGLDGLPITMNPHEECSEPNYWLSCILIDEDAYNGGVTPEKIRLTLQKYNVESRPIWKPMHLQPIFEGCKYVAAGVSTAVGYDEEERSIWSNDSVSEDIFKRGLCLPTDLNMTEEQQGMVIEVIRGCF